MGREGKYSRRYNELNEYENHIRTKLIITVRVKYSKMIYHLLVYPNFYLFIFLNIGLVTSRIIIIEKYSFYHMKSAMFILFLFF